MERIIFFGCSLTYGHGLPDCIVPPKSPGETHSNMGWPSIVAANLGNKKQINMSYPGASNKRIWNTIINFEFESTDIVFVQWTYKERTCVIKKDTVFNIGPWMNHEYYKTIYDANDHLVMSKLFINHANNFLESKKIKFYNLVAGKSEIEALTFGDDTCDHIPVYMTELRKIYPLAIDHNHPGIECQLMYAKKILNYLDIENDIPNIKPLGFFGRIKRDIEYKKGTKIK